MLVTLALLVFLGSILVFFSEEFIKIFKKLFAIKGAKLFIPLFLASWLIYTFDFWFLWIAFYLRETLLYVVMFLTSIMPFRTGANSVALVILLTTASVVPVFILDIQSRRKSFRKYKYPYVTSWIIWILCVVLLVII
ncbi:hypothetical protein [Legionella sainthelensi]|uniref:Uncharacterized protein n=1 Tax=Legionella sainthelensi TaxID=28087 RepID=A0A2H5FKT8_9GAMM|nr:hypothetical protein [Legionella sainthelensi]AUH72165.1 hypothetical protein CAB17_08875 [Legionella sainthelensi]